MSSDIRQRPEGALLRTYLTAAGLSPEAFAKPLVGVVTVSTQVFTEKPHAKLLGDAAVEGAHAAGALTVRWDSARSPDLVTWGHADGYSFAWRDLLADVIESWSRQQAVDGLVLAGDAPETLIGMAMAAARLNVPATLVIAGSNRWEYLEGKEKNGAKDAATDPFELLSNTLFAKKRLTTNGPAQIDHFKRCLLAEDDHASNATAFVLEALGLSLPGMSTAAPESARAREIARSSGGRVVELVKLGHGFRRFLNANAFHNAIRFNAGLGGSVDVAVHLIALAQEVGVPLTLDAFDKAARETPQVACLGRVGQRAPSRADDLERAGGVWAVMHALKGVVLPAVTVSGRGALEFARSSTPRDTHVISGTRWNRKQSGIGVLRGNLAPQGAVYLLNQVLPDMALVHGTALVFDKEIDAAQALDQGLVKKGAVLVVRNQGPKGGPGLRKLRILPVLLESRGLNRFVPIVTDGRLPDEPAGLFISLVAPEGATMGALGVLKTGDSIDIDLTARSLSVRLTDMDLRVRYARWQAPVNRNQRDFLARYARSVSEVSEGAVLK